MNDKSVVKTIGYDVKIKEYSNGKIEYIKYSKSIYRNVPKDKTESQIKGRRKQKENQYSEIRSDSITRTYSALIDYAVENSHLFKTFITFTFKECITDLDIANKKFNKAMYKIRTLYPDLIYLGVPEFQKRGAVHYHLMTNIDISNNKIIRKQENKENMYDVIQWKNGFSSVFNLDQTDDKFSVAAYLTKYFYKDIDNRLFGRNKILKSNNLKKPIAYIYSDNSKELENYQNYIKKYKIEKEKKHIQAKNKYMPSQSIYHFDVK